jgi:hypothetical protein
MRSIKNTLRHNALLGIAVGTAFLASAGAALADSPAERATPCFYSTQWHGWKSPSPDVIYLGVNMHDVYRVDLSAGSRMLQTPGVHLVSRLRGSSSICTALDLQLEVADDTGTGGRLGGGIDGLGGGGMRQPLIASKLTKLTPEEIAAIPKQFRPN